MRHLPFQVQKNQSPKYRMREVGSQPSYVKDLDWGVEGGGVVRGGGGGVGDRKGPSAQAAETGAGGKLIAMSQGYQMSGAGFWLIS